MSQLKYYDISSGTWLPAVVGAQGPTGPQGEVGPTGPSGESALSDLIDVSVAFATNGSVLAYNTDTSLWEATQIRDLVVQILIESGAISIDGGSYNTTTFAGTIDGGSYNTTSFTTIYDGGSAGSI